MISIPTPDQAWEGIAVAVSWLPYIVEVLRQFLLQKRFYTVLPDEIKRTLPDAPATSDRLYLASNRFMISLWKHIFAKNAGDPHWLRKEKKKMRMSLYRELVFALLGLVVTGALLKRGWRPLI